MYFLFIHLKYLCLTKWCSFICCVADEGDGRVCASQPAKRDELKMRGLPWSSSYVRCRPSILAREERIMQAELCSTICFVFVCNSCSSPVSSVLISSRIVCVGNGIATIGVIRRRFTVKVKPITMEMQVKASIFTVFSCSVHCIIAPRSRLRVVWF